MHGVIRRIRRFRKGEKGFTLIELLVVIIIIAILAAIAIPTFLGQRQKAQDAAAKSLVRNAMSSIEASFVDNQTFIPGTMTAAILQAIEPSIKFDPVAPTLSAAGVFGAVTASTTATNHVAYDGTATTYAVATYSAAKHFFGVYVDKSAAGNTFWKLLASVAGQGVSGW